MVPVPDSYMIVLVETTMVVVSAQVFQVCRFPPLVKSPRYQQLAFSQEFEAQCRREASGRGTQLETLPKWGLTQTAAPQAPRNNSRRAQESSAADCLAKLGQRRQSRRRGWHHPERRVRPSNRSSLRWHGAAPRHLRVLRSKKSTPVSSVGCCQGISVGSSL